MMRLAYQRKVWALVLMMRKVYDRPWLRFFVRGREFLVAGPLVFDWRPLKRKLYKKKRPTADYPNKWERMWEDTK